jgi:hypothetical protein
VERTPLNKLRGEEWARLENSGKPFRLRVVRDGQTMELAVEVTTLVE